MKKHLCLILVLLLTATAFAGCEKPHKEDASASAPQISSDASSHESSSVNSQEVSSEADEETVMLPTLDGGMTFSFSSGVGAWSTEIGIRADGTFDGEFHDSDMGSTGEGYPDGTVSVCVFSGRFENIEKIDEHSYKMTLGEVVTKNQVGEEWIDDGVKYIAAQPYGLEEGTEFVFFLPTAPIEGMDEEGFLSWWPYRFEQSENPRDTLGCYGIWNVATDHGFFSEK